MVSPDHPSVALIAGPTASGKSAAAIAVAEAHGGIVINADASQVYRDLRILSARPSAKDEARVPHRLFGHVDGADTSYSAARWAAEATAAIDAAHAAGRLPVLVGGTGLYLRTLLDGIAPVPDIDPEIRATVRALPVAEAHRQLSTEDPAAAARLAPADTTRVARALEVVRATGHPLGHWQRQLSGGIGHRIRLAAIRLLPPREQLFTAIDARAAIMLDGGAPAEVAALLTRDDISPDAPVRRAIGVAAIADHLAGHASHEETLERLRSDTRRYAKRQFTWFRNQPSPEWIITQQNDSIPSSIDALLS
ncbi:tRNA (adenosine(37)-N6)-dimethylallyltransferase MiaA [Sphingomonas sp. BT553]|uniref:tRNA dimethylallyltransferase n=1 Tax=Sphingomonas mollis TaxID=2795726 RepID=A0ABS0XL53_9SPHN|nr:tRNA (adenosine(37)-N6)-dimethylallyltransferase MiaA [Sphingomonas sp. BT553]